MSEPKRITVNLGVKAVEGLELAEKLHGLSVTEAVNKGLVLLGIQVLNQENGSGFYVRTENGEYERLYLF